MSTTSPKKRKSVPNSPKKLQKDNSLSSDSANSRSFESQKASDSNPDGKYVENKERIKQRRRREISEHFQTINDAEVADVSLEFLYKPHSITLLAAALGILLYCALVSDSSDRVHNIWSGVRALLFIFLVLSVLVFPNGPFIRPHPVVWRIVFGLSVLYLLALQFALFQSFADIKNMLRWYDPDNLNKEAIEEKEYGVNCSHITIERLWSHVDVYALGHFLGWGMKAMLIRHTLLCWYISAAWEVTETIVNSSITLQPGILQACDIADSEALERWMVSAEFGVTIYEMVYRSFNEKSMFHHYDFH